MASKVHYEVETRLTCDRCKAEVTIYPSVNPKAGRGWLSLHTPGIVPTESWDLCPLCSQDFRDEFLKANKP